MEPRIDRLDALIATLRLHGVSPPARSDPGLAAGRKIKLDIYNPVAHREIDDQIATAASAPDRLAEKDRALHFTVDSATARVTVEVHDLRGNLLFTIPASKAIEIAAGADLDDG